MLAGAADTPELKAETDARIDRLQAERDGVVLVSEMKPRESVRQVLSHALAFLCPSVYEPLGIVNLEAMACETAVVASAVGGIPEVVVDGETGLLVTYDPADHRRLRARHRRPRQRTGRRPARPGGAGRRAVASFDGGVAEQTVLVEPRFDWAAIASPRAAMPLVAAEVRRLVCRDRRACRYT